MNEGIKGAPVIITSWCVNENGIRKKPRVAQIRFAVFQHSSKKSNKRWGVKWVKYRTELTKYWLPITSTSFATDVFYTRVAPSKRYDVLKEDFDYLFIGGVTVGMVVLSFISRHFALKKMERRAWR